jgi:hypothetical protein
MKKIIFILFLASCQPVQEQTTEQPKQLVKGLIVKKEIRKNVKGEPIYVTTINMNGTLVEFYGINYYLMEEGDTIQVEQGDTSEITH